MSASISHALLLTAGLGTRLRPLTLVRAKPAVPLAGEPLVSRIIRWLVSHGVLDLVLNLHYQPESIARVVGDGHQFGARVRYSWEQPAVLGSAGGPRLAEPIVGADPFFIINGDTLTDVDVSQVARAHLASDALVTMALVPNTQPDQYGGVRLDAEGRVTGFARRGADAIGSFHFIGVQVASAAAFAAVTPGTVANSVGDVYDRLLTERPGCIRGVVSNAGFWDIGNIKDYWLTSQAFATAGDAAKDVEARGTLGRGRDVRVEAGATIRETILWDRVSIGAGAQLDGCIVTDDVVIPAGASYRDAILWMDPVQGLTVAPRLPA